MDNHVYLHVTSIIACMITQLATERLPLIMHRPFVVLQTPRPFAGKITLYTIEWPNFKVHSHVFLQISICNGLVVALGAVERLLSGVHKLVFDHVT